MNSSLRALLRRATVPALAAALAAFPAAAQIDGFGQNKVTYESFDWRVYPSPHFDVHYYGAEEIFLEEVVSYAESAYVEISKTLDHELRFRVPLIVYKTHAEFLQTNIELSELPEGVAAFAEPFQNRMVLPIDLPPRELYELVAHELTHIFQYSIFYEGYLGRALRSQAPRWLMEGMASYLAHDEDSIDRMVLRDAVVNGVLPRLQDLDNVSPFLTYRYGHAVFDYIEQEHRKEGVRSFIYEFRKVLLTGNVEKAIKEAFGYDEAEFSRKFARYLQRRYLPVLLEKKAPEDYGTEIGIRKPGVFSFSPAVSPSGELVAVLASPKMEIDIVILSAEDGERVRNLTKGWTNKWRTLIAEGFAGKRDLAWSPVGDEVASFVRRENRWPLVIHDALRGRILRWYDLAGYAESASPAFSPDGKRVAFESNKDGIVDIFELDLETKEVRNLTRDDHFDANPWYAPDGKTLVYGRQVGDAWKIFSVDLSDPSLKTQLTFGTSSEIQPSYARDGKRLFFTSDRGPEGIFNVHSLDLATGEITQHTDVVGGCFTPIQMADREGEAQVVFTSFFEGTFRLFRMPLRHAGEAAPTSRPSSSSSPAASPVPPSSAVSSSVGSSSVPPSPAPPEPPTSAPRPSAADEEPRPSAPSAPLGGQPLAPPSTAPDTVPFEPPLRLRVDEGKKRPYKITWDIEAPQIVVGVADDGTFLSNTAIQFSDLLGDHRVQVLASSVSSFSNTSATYLNLKRRVHWGASIFDYRDYFVTLQNASFGANRDQVQRSTGVTAFLQYPLSRYYRLEGSAGYLDRSQDFVQNSGFGFQLVTVGDRFALLGAELTGDTTRFAAFGPASFGPFHGKRFSLGMTYGIDAGSEVPGDLLEYRADVRTYKQLTRRSVLAWRLAGVISAGDRESYYSLGGINQLRGFEFREFFGSRAAWSNLELRFPLVDELRFPFAGLYSIRGFLFADVGAAWFSDGGVYDSQAEFVAIRQQPEFRFWDSDNNRLQDGRASYGVGFQFFFSGLQLNWSWARALPYTRFQQTLAGPSTVQFTPVEVEPQGSRMDFYVVYDF